MLAGPPNVGKSSLLNALARRDAAIVSEEAGTTRDVIEVQLDLRGLPVIVTDTAGIRAARRDRGGGHPPHAGPSEDADLVLWMVDATAPEESSAPIRASSPMRVINKIDLPEILRQMRASPRL